MLTLDLSSKASQQVDLTGAELAGAVEAMKEEGFVVLAGVVNPEHLDMVCERMLEDTAAVLSQQDPAINFVSGHLQQDPPPFPPYLFPDVLCNRYVIRVTRELLGLGVHNSLYSGNVNLPGSQEQPVHVDEGQLWPRLHTAHPPARIIVNVCLVDVDARNGSTELWPGTHADTTISKASDSLRIPVPLLEARRASVPPLRADTRKGDVLLRDARLWHRGTANNGSQPRPMLAMVHSPSWLGTITTLRFPKDTERLLANPDLVTVATFEEGPIDYLRTEKLYVEATHR